MTEPTIEMVPRKIKLEGGGHYSLVRERDQIGDSGRMLRSIDPTTGEQVGENGEIVLGCCLQCGSDYARTMQWQDWWLTTPVAEIIEVVSPSEVRLKTVNNSVYIVKAG